MAQYNNIPQYKVSILVPIYNVELYIERCALSLFNQTYAHETEFIFVNDCSSDESLKILYDVIELFPLLRDHIKVISHQRNRGLACARETALRESTSEYILTVDSDDWIEHDMVEKLYIATENTSIDMISCDYFVEYEQKSIVISQCIGNSPIECLQNVFLGKSHGGTCLRLIRRKIYSDHDIHYIEGLNMLEDISVLHKILLHAKTIKHIKKPYYHYYQGNINSYSTKLSKSSKQNLLDIVPFIEKELNLHNCDSQIWDSFQVFKFRIKSLLIENAESIKEIRLYNSLFQDIHISMQHGNLNKKERLLLFLGPSLPLGAYFVVLVIRIVKRVRSKFLFM